MKNEIERSNSDEDLDTEDIFIRNLKKYTNLDSKSKKYSDIQIRDETTERKPAWIDNEDENISVAEALKIQKRKLPFGGINEKTNKYQKLLKHKFENLVGTPSWANLNEQKDHDNSDSDNDVLQSCGFISKNITKVRLAKNELEFKKLNDLNCQTYCEGPYINSVNFHKNSTVGLVAGNSGICSIFVVDGVTNNKLHSIKFNKFPIRSAKFTNDGNSILFGSTKHSYIYQYDMEKCEETRIPLPHGITNMKSFQLSECDDFLAIPGKFGEVHLLNSRTKELIKTLKQESNVTSISFGSNSDHLFGHGENGQVTIWSLKTQRPINTFYDDGCIQGTCIAISPTYVATGSAQGVVNLYEYDSVFCTKTPKPKKILLNLTTSISTLKFNPSEEILLFGSNECNNGLRLLHLESLTVFSNFPGKLAKIKEVISTDFSPNSGYLSVGNSKSCVLLYRLKHFKNY